MQHDRHEHLQSATRGVRRTSHHRGSAWHQRFTGWKAIKEGSAGNNFVVFSMDGAVGQHRQVSTAQTSQKALVTSQEQFLVKVVDMSVRVQRPFPDGSKCCTETNESAAIGI